MQVTYHLLYLFFYIIGFDQKSFDFAAGDNPAFRNVGVSCQDDPVFIQSNIHHLSITFTVEKYGIIAEKSKQFNEFADILIHDKFRLIDLNLTPEEYLVIGY